LTPLRNDASNAATTVLLLHVLALSSLAVMH
jgi:hypothetical protein